MTRLETLCKLNELLLTEMPAYQSQAERFPKEEEAQWRLFRSLVNLREPAPAGEEFLALQESFLREETARKGVTDLADLTPVEPGIYLWQGDITTLRCGAVVNAANSGMTGCYLPLHACIDNAIHTFAGTELRWECARLMAEQGYPEPTGRAKLTGAYALPCDFILHTVGPIVTGEVTPRQEEELRSCYRACLQLAAEKGVESVAFCCISTGEFRFPNRRAAEIAIETVREYRRTNSGVAVIFNVFKQEDLDIYRELLHTA